MVKIKQFLKSLILGSSSINDKAVCDSNNVECYSKEKNGNNVKTSNDIVLETHKTINELKARNDQEILLIKQKEIQFTQAIDEKKKKNDIVYHDELKKIEEEKEKLEKEMKLLMED